LRSGDESGVDGSIGGALPDSRGIPANPMEW
jgi:hypothetical protein